MRFILLFFCLSTILLACNNKKERAAKNKEPFDKLKWRTSDGKGHPYRDKMLDHLIASKRLKGMKYDSVLDLLGVPTRSDTNYLFYRISQTRIGFFPLHTKSLVIEFEADSTVRTTKIHE